MQKNDKSHYCQIINARPKIDARPPKFKAGTFLRVTEMKSDNDCLKRIIAENITMLEKINQIQRIEGAVKSYNKSLAIRKTRIPNVKKWLKQIDEENYFLGRKLLCMKPTMNTRNPITLKNKSTRRTPVEQEQIRKELYRKYKDIMPIHNPDAIPLLLLPKIYIDLGVKNVRPLDRLVIVLSTEAAPNVVLQFVRMCKSRTSTLSFRRIYPNLWIEGQMTVPPGTDLGIKQRFSSQFDHGQAGTLAILERESKGKFQFSISFKPLKVLNGKRVAFGKVIEGLKILAAVQDYGTKNGKPKKEIVVTDCGLVQ